MLMHERDGKIMNAQIEVQVEGKPRLLCEVTAGSLVVIGRAPEADCRVEGEPYLGRKHVEVTLTGDRLSVRRLPGASNPVFHRGEAKEEFFMSSGEQFVIGKTRFLFQLREAAKASPQEAAPDQSHTISASDLYGMGGGDRLRLLDLLELPEILRLKSRGEFFVHIAGLLRLATGASWVRVATEDGRVLAEDAANDTERRFHMNSALVQAALKEIPRPTLYSWSKPLGDLQLSVQQDIDWAICAAYQVPGERPFLLYLAGKGGAEQSQHENGRFVGLVADMVGRSLAVQSLENVQGRLKRYFSGPVIEKIMGSSDLNELKPRVTQSTIMFFDIRGFSKRTEGKNEKILSYLGELRNVMTAMTEEILKENGAVLQYMGDGILACWNVPITDELHIDRACRAVLRMTVRLAEVTEGWRCGIGLHTGEVVAGTIGSDQVFSYGVMGEVVNQASRIEGITKVVETPILVTREVAERVSAQTASTLRVGRFQPKGMNTALDLYELSPPNVDQGRIDAFASGLKAFENGEWENAYVIFDKLPPSDLPARYLKSLAESYRRHPPKDWRGVIELTEK